MNGKLIIFNTISHDGGQSPGASVAEDKKIRIVEQPGRLKMDVIETGSAAGSNGDFEAIRAIALSIKDSRICSPAHANDHDISRAAKASKLTGQFHIHTFVATPTLHMEKKLCMSPGQVYEQARLVMRFAHQFTDDIGLSPEDGSRSDMDFLRHVLEDVIAEGAIAINLPDTVGYMVPEGYAVLIRLMCERIPNSDEAVWSVHCHNDLGMAVANFPAATKLNDARQIECTINGLSERAGNTGLEEAVTAVETCRDYFNLDADVDTTQIVPASKLISQITGFIVRLNKAIVGANAFVYALGIHQDGVLKACDTHEVIRVENVGWAVNKIVLDELSGRNAFEQCLQELSIGLNSGAELNVAFIRFKKLADREAEVFDEDIVAIVSNEAQHSKDGRFHSVPLAQRSEIGKRSYTHTTFVVDGKEVTGGVGGNGLIGATLNTIESRAANEVEQLPCSVNAITTDTQAQGEVTVRLLKSGRVINGVGIDPDIVAAPAEAYLVTLNKLRDKSNEKLNLQIRSQASSTQAEVSPDPNMITTERIPGYPPRRKAGVVTPDTSGACTMSAAFENGVCVVHGTAGPEVRVRRPTSRGCCRLDV